MDVAELLEARGAGKITHPGGTLLRHLFRVRDELEEWGARPDLSAAGSAHAFYGTDGFATALGDLAERPVLAAAIGEEAERIVHLYASCDRGFTHRRLADGAFKDRFTGSVREIPFGDRCDFAELTVANELDVLRHDAELRARYGRALSELFASWDGLLSPRARAAVRAAFRTGR